MQDLHIHTQPGRKDSPKEFMDKTRAGGVTGGAVFSVHPKGYWPEEHEDQRPEALVDYIMEFTSQTPGFRPVYWFDPTDKDAVEQVYMAKEKGIAGFKVICNHFFPKEGMKAYHAIAETGLPLIFHSGVLYNNQPSSDFNRPMSFECLMDVPQLRFSLAHISWPWSPELVALFGKLNALDNRARRGEDTGEKFTGGRSRMYFDFTPGTPPIFRRDAIRQVYMCGLRVKDRVMWGTDCSANDYSAAYAQYWAKLDREIFAEISADPNRYRVAGQPEYEYSDIWDLATEKNIRTFFGEDAKN